jgi:hypothetical protein
MLWPMGCEGYPAFALAARRAWLISRYGQPPVKQHFGRLVPFCVPMMPIVGLRSMASLRPTPWPLLCGRSWPCSTWAGRASDLLRARIAVGNDVPDRTVGWPRTVGIDIAFSREGRTGSRMIRMTSLTESRRRSTGNGSGGLSENAR